MSLPRTRRFHFLGTYETKHNMYHAIVICDKYGNVLRNRFPKVEEFYEHIQEVIWRFSDCIASKHANEVMNLNEITGKKFVKIPDSENFQRIYGRTKLCRGKWPGTRRYLYQNIHDLLYHEEVFFKEGNVWVFGNMDFINDLRTIIDEIRVCVCNVDFNDYNEEIDYLNFFDFAKKFGFKEVSNMVTKRSREMAEIANRKKKTITEEILPNGMKMIRTQEAGDKSKLPEIYDYELKYYKFSQEHD